MPEADDEDYEYLIQYKWYLNARDNGRYNYVRRENYGKHGEPISMHRDVMKAKKGEYIDHIDHNCLNNQKYNLRICTHKDNSRNSLLRRDSKSGFKGVCWHKRGKKWSAQITVYYKKIHLGLFSDKIKAPKVYDEAAKKYFGEFAHTNF